MYAISSYTSMPLTDSKPVTLHLASQVTCYDIFHLEHWKSGVFRWLQLSEIPNPPDAHMCLFFLFGSCYHIYRLTHPHILLPNKPCMLMMFRSQFCILSILTSTCTLSILYMLVITPSIFFLKEIERPKTPVPLEQTCVDDFHTPDKVCTLPQYISN